MYTSGSELKRRRDPLGFRLGLLAAATTAAGLCCGGCPDVRNGVIDALERGTIRAATEDLGNTAEDLFTDSLVSSMITLFFSDLRATNVQP